MKGNIQTKILVYFELKFACSYCDHWDARWEKILKTQSAEQKITQNTTDLRKKRTKIKSRLRRGRVKENRCFYCKHDLFLIIAWLSATIQMLQTLWQISRMDSSSRSVLPSLPRVLAGKPLHSAAMWAKPRKPEKHLDVSEQTRWGLWSVRVYVRTVLDCLCSHCGVPSDPSTPATVSLHSSACVSLDEMIPLTGGEVMWPQCSR